MRPANWLASVPNPFLLKVPPTWFLRDLLAFDDQLVLFPGQTEACYRLARKRSRTAGLQTVTKWITAAGMGVPTETEVYVHHGLLPVMAITPTVQWSPLILHELRRRDTWTIDQPETALDVHEERAQDRRDRTARDEFTARAGAAYRALKRAPGGSEVFVQGYTPTSGTGSVAR